METKVRNLQSPSTGHQTIWTSKVTMCSKLGGIVQEMQSRHQISDKTSYEHQIQLDVRILKDVLKSAFGTEVSKENDSLWLDMGSDETVDVGMPDFSH